MGGGFRFPGNGSRTVVLLGHTGNGKSATGNSILGMKAFESRTSMLSVTNNVECLTTTIADGEVVNVIDTPGLFDPSFGPEFISKEIEKCIDLANDGIHAILLVFSVRTRFTEEKCDAIENLQKIFGPKITDYIILVFTGGDSLEKNQSLENFLLCGCPDSLKNVLDVCRNRMVLFDNETKDEKKKVAQLQRLLGLVDKVIEENDGKPYTTEEKIESKASNGSHDEQLKWMMDKVECKLMETIKDMQKQLEEEKSARLNGEKIAEDAQKRSEEEIQKLSERLAEAQKDSDYEMKELRNNLANDKKIAEDAKKRSEEEIQKLSEKLAEAQKDSDYEMKELRNNLANDKKIAEDAKKRSEEEIQKLSEKLAEAQKDSDYEMKELRNNLANVEKIAEDAQKRSDEEIQKLSDKLAAAHLSAEWIARDAQKRSEEEIQKLSERLDEAQKISDEEMKEVRENLANIKKNDMNLNGFRLIPPSLKRSHNCPASG